MIKKKKKMDANSNKLPDFFKVFLPEYSSERMLVPIAFVAKLNKPIPQISILERRSGSHWLVKAVKDGGKVYLQEGWQEFVRDNGIKIGDFLVFSYDGDKTFYVTVLDNSMCEKEEMFSSVQGVVDRRRMTKKEGKSKRGQEDRERKEEEEEERGFNKDGGGNDDFSADLEANDEEEQLNEARDDKDNNDEDYTEGSNGDDGVEIVEDEDEDWDGKGLNKNGIGNDDLTVDLEADDGEDQLSGSSDDEDYIYDLDGDDGVELVEEDEEFSDFIDCDEDHIDTIREGLEKSKGKRRYRETKAGESSKSRKKKSEAKMCFQTSNPYFQPKLCGHGLRYLYIPTNVLKDFKVKLSPKIQFHDPLKRKWDGHVLVWKDGRTYIKGWRAVCRWNTLKEGDHCKCELLLGKNLLCDTIQVHIIYRC